MIAEIKPTNDAFENQWKAVTDWEVRDDVRRWENEGNLERLISLVNVYDNVWPRFSNLGNYVAAAARRLVDARYPLRRDPVRRVGRRR